MSEKNNQVKKSDYLFYVTRHPKHMEVPAPSNFVQRLIKGAVSVALVTSMTPIVSFADEQDNISTNTQPTVSKIDAANENIGREEENFSGDASFDTSDEDRATGSLVQQNTIDSKHQMADLIIKQISEKIAVDQVDHRSNTIALRFKIDDDNLARQYSIECRIVDNVSDFGTDAAGAKVIERQIDNNSKQTVKDTVAFDVADSDVSNLNLNLGAVRFVITDKDGAVAESYSNLSPIQLEQDQWRYVANEVDKQNAVQNNASGLESSQTAEMEQHKKEQELLASTVKKQQDLQSYILANKLDLSDIEDPALVVEPLLAGNAVNAAAFYSGVTDTKESLTLRVVDDSLEWPEDSYTASGTRVFGAMSEGETLSSFALSVEDSDNPTALPVGLGWKYTNERGNEISGNSLPITISLDPVASTNQYQFTLKKKGSTDESIDLSDIYIQYTADTFLPGGSLMSERNPKLALSDILGVSSLAFDTTAPTITIESSNMIGPDGQSFITIEDDHLASLIQNVTLPTASDDLKNTAILTVISKADQSVLYTLTLGTIASTAVGKQCANNNGTSLKIPLKAGAVKGATEVTFENDTIVVPDGEYVLESTTDLADASGNQVSTSCNKDIVVKAIASEIAIDTAAIQDATKHNDVYYINTDQLIKVSSTAIDLAGLADSEDNKPIVTIKGTDSQGQCIDKVVTVKDIKDAPNNSIYIAIGNMQPSDGTTSLISLSEGEYALTFLPELEAPIVDIAGSPLKSSEQSAMTENNSDIKFVYDTTAPTINKVTSNKSYSNAYADKSILFHKEQTTLTATLGDSFGLMQEASFAFLWEGAKAAYDVSGKARGTVTIDLKDGNELTPLQVLTVTDYAGNSSYWAISSKDGTYTEITQGITYQIEDHALFPDKVIQDTVMPQISLSGVNAGAYYKEPVIARLDVNELNFKYLKRYDSGQNVLTIDKKSADPSRSPSQTKVSVGEFKALDAETGKYYYERPFDSDGHYAISAQVVDPAGNLAATQVGEFTVDRTAPTLDFAWDNNDVQNGKYYKAGRTATITVVEHNFDPNLVKIEAPGGSVGSWSANGDTHTIKVSYNSDAVCGLSVEVVDKAGNAVSKSVDEFVIDTTAPTIVFAGVEESHAYNGEVTPIIEFTDEANFDSSGVSYSLTGSKNGGVSYSASESASTNGSTVTYSDFEHAIGVDDIYTIKAHVADLAGNEFESDITFSVNRFGSTFMVVYPTTNERVNPVNPDDPNDFGFLSEAPEILIREVNVNPIDMSQSSVAVTYNLKTENLNKVSDLSQPGFTLAESTTGDGWKSYDYIVSRNSFVGKSNGSTDGNYQIEVSSHDSASNYNTSAQFWQESAKDDSNDGEHASSAVVKFTLDTTDPEIYGVSVENGGIYGNSGNYQASFNAADNIGIKPEDIQVKLNGQTVEFAAVEGSNAQYAFNIDQNMLGFEDLVVEAKDYAGNIKTYHASFVDALWPAFLVAGLVIVAVAGIAVGMHIRRRRIAEEDE